MLCVWTYCYEKVSYVPRTTLCLFKPFCSSLGGSGPSNAVTLEQQLQTELVLLGKKKVSSLKAGEVIPRSRQQVWSSPHRGGLRSTRS